ncbi:putative pre-mRNA-splicing factor ATP-dependent RNA helicase DHX32 [Brachyhypopomus gauderio]|uniref:putative pre-mRNA-splicing factor ATP-dependent RNA helicase DHX32 n=1 Tax=Brachyhypopomus gauderio TaxID=698409 RepID=UPI00404111F8
MQALEELDYLTALDNDGNLSEIAVIMSELPLEPQMAKSLLAEFDCVSEVLTIAAMLTAPSCFLAPPVEFKQKALACHHSFHHADGDHFTLINVYNAYKHSQHSSRSSLAQWCADHYLSLAALQTADAVRAELTEILRRIELQVSSPAFGSKTNRLNTKQVLLAGFFMQVARDIDGSGNYFILTHKHVAQIHPLSCYGTEPQKWNLPEWVVYHEHTLSENNCIRTVTQISARVSLFYEFICMAPQYFFYNLPPSESKEVLQHITEHSLAAPPKGKREPQIQNNTTHEEQPYERCSSLAQWCADHYLSLAALQTADAVRAELTEILRRIELQVSSPAFGSKTNRLNTKQVLLAGFFMQVARDIDGSGNYFILTHKHVAQIHPLSCYGTEPHKRNLPEWVVYHEHTLSENNCIRTVTQISARSSGMFICMAPQYFFYNLPPSESKEVLQHITEHSLAAPPKGKREPQIQNNATHEEQPYERCVIQ